jgi:hypothetical protein
MSRVSRQLLILPGLTNPDVDAEYRGVYELLAQEASERGYRQVHTDVRYPGQCASTERGAAERLTLAGAVNRVKERAMQFPSERFDVLARSFGCVVALKTWCNAEGSLPKPSRIILWAPPPFWMLWDFFVLRYVEKAGQFLDKGVRIGANFFASVEPVESLLQCVPVATVVAAGTLDKYCTSTYFEYLRSLDHSPNVRFQPLVEGAPHSVTDLAGLDVVRAYLEALLPA